MSSTMMDSTTTQTPQDEISDASLHGGLAAILLLALVVCVGIVISHLGANGRCKWWSRQCAAIEGLRDVQGHDNNAFSSCPPSYEEAISDTAHRIYTLPDVTSSPCEPSNYDVSHSSGEHCNSRIYSERDHMVPPPSSISNSNRGSGARSSGDTPIVENPPDYFDVLGSWLNQQRLVRGDVEAYPPCHGIPPPSYKQALQKCHQSASRQLAEDTRTEMATQPQRPHHCLFNDTTRGSIQEETYSENAIHEETYSHHVHTGSRSVSVCTRQVPDSSSQSDHFVSLHL